MTNIPKFELDPEVDFCFNNNTLEHVIIENQDGKPIVIVEPFKSSITHLKVPHIKALVKLPEWLSYDDGIFQFQIRQLGKWTSFIYNKSKKILYISPAIVNKSERYDRISCDTIEIAEVMIKTMIEDDIKSILDIGYIR